MHPFTFELQTYTYARIDLCTSIQVQSSTIRLTGGRWLVRYWRRCLISSSCSTWLTMSSSLWVCWPPRGSFIKSSSTTEQGSEWTSVYCVTIEPVYSGQCIRKPPPCWLKLQVAKLHNMRCTPLKFKTATSQFRIHCIMFVMIFILIQVLCPTRWWLASEHSLCWHLLQVGWGWAHFHGPWPHQVWQCPPNLLPIPCSQINRYTM